MFPPSCGRCELYDHMTARSRQVVRQLVDGREVTIGGEAAGPMELEQRRALSLLATALEQLAQKSGADLATAFVQEFKDHQLPEPTEPPTSAADAPARVRWRVGKVRACSFRGLAPAGQVWTRDFEGRSHLLYGPNGCGKSSLLGAIAWCLTGLVFRDDCPPTTPEDIPVYTDADKAKTARARPDALSLTDGQGHSTDSDREYWVELELIPDKGPDGSGRRWLRRHSAKGLSTSGDRATWTPVERLDDMGIAELDAELHTAMPARVPHVRFGKDRNLLGLFSQLAGLDDLEQIARLAASTLREVHRETNKLRDVHIPGQEKLIAESAVAINRDATKAIRELPTYAQGLADDRTLEAIQAFGKDLSESLGTACTQLAENLGVDIPAPEAPEYSAVKKQLTLLPGQVDTAVGELGKPLSDVMPKSVGLDVPSSEELDRLAQRLKDFQKGAGEKARGCLEWAVQQQVDEKASLMLIAAGHFPKGSKDCPVCTQDLERVPEVKQRLKELRPLAGHPHLGKGVEDLERELLAQLNEFLPPALREQGAETLADRLLADWSALEEDRFPGLLAGVAKRFDPSMQALSEPLRTEPLAHIPPMAGGYETQFPQAFTTLDAGILEAWRYVQLMRCGVRHGEKLRRELTHLLKPSSDGGTDDSLSAILERGSATTAEIDALSAVRASAGTLSKAQKKLEDLRTRAQAFEGAGAAIEPTKGVARLLQQEVLDVVGSVEPKMKELYATLYPDELLKLDMVTPGHAANRAIRDEINAYFRAGQQRVPVAPFSNSGRFRALVLSFVFALLDNSRGTLGVLLLDDPALSLDDEHKSRFVQHLIGPLLDQNQVLVGTHYRDFYERAKLTFVGEECWELVPRRTVRDAVSFETGDLLARLERLLSGPPSRLRDAAPNLRRWIESALASLSGDCPEPFVVYNNIPQSIDNYAAITDPRVVTPERGRIVSALRSPEVQWVRNPVAHTGHRTPQEIEDALSCLKECDKDVQTELVRFKELSLRAADARALPAVVEVAPLTMRNALAPATVKIVTQAAAARDGMAIALDEHAVAQIAECPLALMKLDTLQPVARVGQYLILDAEEREPGNKDLVVAETGPDERYARRFWERDNAVHLEAQNATPPYYAPVTLTRGACRIRRVTGVVFEPLTGLRRGTVAAEWVPASGSPLDLLANAVGVRVQGTSLEPVAWDGQIALIRRRDGAEDLSLIRPDTLACVDIDQQGAVIKRCYPSSDEWLLCSVNVNERQEPMRVSASSILHVYPLIGVLFEVAGESATDP